MPQQREMYQPLYEAIMGRLSSVPQYTGRRSVGYSGPISGQPVNTNPLGINPQAKSNSGSLPTIRGWATDALARWAQGNKPDLSSLISARMFPGMTAPNTPAAPMVKRTPGPRVSRYERENGLY